MLRTYNPLRSVTVWKFPEPPIARSQGKAAPVVLHRLDWRAVGLPENDGKVAFIIDNAFTPDECQNLLKAAEDSAPWTPAAVHGSPQKQIGKIREDYRKSSRILLDDFELADYILQKLKPYMPEEALTAPEGKLEQFGLGKRNTMDKKKFDSTSVTLTRLNERLRFLKYVRGDFFGTHWDGMHYTPDRTELSCLTLQLYLNGSKEELQGGATQFLSNRTPYILVDVDPRPGRVLVFEQRNLLHRGTEVTKGEKYAIRTDLMYKKVAV